MWMRRRLPMAVLLIGIATAAVGDTGRTIIRDQRAAERLRGNEGMTLQWIGWTGAAP